MQSFLKIFYRTWFRLFKFTITTLKLTFTKNTLYPYFSICSKERTEESVYKKYIFDHFLYLCGRLFLKILVNCSENFFFLRRAMFCSSNVFKSFSKLIRDISSSIFCTFGYSWEYDSCEFTEYLCVTVFKLFKFLTVWRKMKLNLTKFLCMHSNTYCCIRWFWCFVHVTDVVP